MSDPPSDCPGGNSMSSSAGWNGGAQRSKRQRTEPGWIVRVGSIVGSRVLGRRFDGLLTVELHVLDIVVGSMLDKLPGEFGRAHFKKLVLECGSADP